MRGEKSDPGVESMGLWGAGLQAHISFADALSSTQFGWIVVQENLWMGKHHQQGFFLGPRQGEALIQLVVAAGLPEEVVKGHPQRIRLGLDFDGPGRPTGLDRASRSPWRTAPGGGNG